MRYECILRLGFVETEWLIPRTEDITSHCFCSSFDWELPLSRPLNLWRNIYSLVTIGALCMEKRLYTSTWFPRNCNVIKSDIFKRPGPVLLCDSLIHCVMFRREEQGWTNLVPRVYSAFKMAAERRRPWHTPLDSPRNSPRIVEYFVTWHIIESCPRYTWSAVPGIKNGWRCLKI